MPLNANKTQTLQDGFDPHAEPGYFNKRLLIESPTANEIVDFASLMYFSDTTMNFIRDKAMRANSPEFKTSNKDRIDAEIETCKFKIDVTMGSMNLPREDVDRGEFHDICQAILELWEHNKCSAIRDETGDNMFKAQTQDRVSQRNNQVLEETSRISQLQQAETPQPGMRLPIIGRFIRR